MAITYHAGRRIQGLEYTASTLTTSGFAQTWGKDPSNSQFEVSSGRINFLDNTSSTGDRTWLDLQSIIGSAVSTTKWLLRFKFNFSTLTSGSYYYEFDAGLSDTTVNHLTNQNYIGVRVLPATIGNLWRPRTTDGTSYPRGGASANISQSFSTGTDYYVEIKRTSASNWSISLSTTDAYDGDIQDDSYSDASGATGLRYFKFGDAVTNTGSGFTMQGVCDVLEFYNDTNTVVKTASGDAKPTNVQVGSRFEETDTRKMYSFNTPEYKVHSFTSDDTFQITSGSGNVEYLVVAGGGGGGTRSGGGGGAGGLLQGTFSNLASGTYSVVVGDGGNGAVSGTHATNGGDSSINSITAFGGGGGKHNWNFDGSSGGSGSGIGQAYSSSSVTTGQGTSGQGNNGGTTSSTSISGTSYWTGSGGGGAGSAGTIGISTPTASANTVGNGGAGLDISITGTSVGYAGGGSGGSEGSTPSGTASHGGGTAGVSGTDGTGGGGGQHSVGGIGGDGGSGIVIVKYNGNQITATGGTITTVDGVWQEIGA